MGPSRWRGATGQRNQLGFLCSIQLPIKPTGGLLAEQGRCHTFFHKGVADPIHGRGSTLHGFGNLCILPARPSRTDIRLQQNPGMDQGRCRPARPGVDQVFQVSAFFIGQKDYVFG